MWKCLCDCGNEIVTGRNDLERGSCKSCGCYRREVTHNRMTTKRFSNIRLYNVYDNMKARCYRPNNIRYKNYGGQGITICDEWLGKNGFDNFCEWSLANGYDPNLPRGKCTIDRIDVNKGYSPQNCRWVDNVVQARNTRKNRWITINGETHCLAEWSEITGISRKTIAKRVDNNCPENLILYKGNLYLRKVDKNKLWVQN